MSALDEIGASAVEAALNQGAAEATARLSQSVFTEVSWRDGRMEKCQESRSLLLRISLLVDDRFSTHATSDLRPAALPPFLARAIEATRVLEPDPDRRLLDRAEMGVAGEDLDASDPNPFPTAEGRRTAVAALEQSLRDAAQDAPLRSAAAHLWDGQTELAMVCSNGFSASYAGTQHGRAVEVTLTDGEGRLPEASVYVTSRHQDDLPSSEQLSADVIGFARRRLGSRATRSGRYPMLVERSRVGRLLGLLVAPLTGAALQEGRSCFADALGRRVSSQGFTLIDDPTLPRGLGSRPFDADGLPGRRTPLIEQGVLANFVLDAYYARRLGRAHTTGAPSNLTVPPGSRSLAEIASELPAAILVEGFLGGNANPATGSFSLGVHGVLLERGEPVQNIGEMNISGTLGELLDRWVEATRDPWEYGAWRTPTLLFDGIQFSGN